MGHKLEMMLKKQWEKQNHEKGLVSNLHMRADRELVFI